MRKKKILAMILVAMLSLSGLTGCSDKDKEDMNNKLNNKTTETTDSKKDNKDDKTSESDNEESKTENTDSKNTESSESKKNDTSDSKKNESTSTKTDDKKNESTSSKKDDKNNSASKPAHQHTWVDHTATKTVTEYIHHDAVYQDVTTPAVTQKQIQCLGCGKWFASAADLDNHAFAVQIGQESGNPSRCGSTSYDAEREVVITPAKTEHKLVKDAWDEPIQKTETYVDYQECTGCHEHRQK